MVHLFNEVQPAMDKGHVSLGVKLAGASSTPGAGAATPSIEAWSPSGGADTSGKAAYAALLAEASDNSIIVMPISLATITAMAQVWAEFVRWRVSILTGNPLVSRPA